MTNSAWLEFTNRASRASAAHLITINRNTTALNSEHSATPTTTIIGAGLSGLALAYRLKQAGLRVSVLEANKAAGGRIQPAGSHNGHQDLGPTWVWPYAQPVVTQWLTELGLSTFDQYDEGLALLDRHPTQAATAQPLPSQQGSARIDGGTHALIRALEKGLPDVIQCGQMVTACKRHNHGWQLSIATPAQASTNADTVKHISAERLIIATPPRLTAAMLETEKESLSEVLPILQAAETWMAPHAKVVVFYDTAFWRETGLSGRIASQVGPLVEVHDHSGPEGTPAALFGFSGVPALARAQAGEQFIAAIEQQLQRCFGDDAPKPTQILVKDWAFDPCTTTEADRNGSGAHPPVLSKLVRQSHCNGSLWFAGSETSAISAGLIEGGLARADEIASQILSVR